MCVHVCVQNFMYINVDMYARLCSVMYGFLTSGSANFYLAEAGAEAGAEELEARLSEFVRILPQVPPGQLQLP